ncbi:MAG: 16S rRNA (guanine(527)-N(7))-methyltransferase [Nitrospira sp.]|nr:MAG: 16S rRNA (guanine(527)-N(7))-methyltransferase [Nitrospira sp.]
MERWPVDLEKFLKKSVSELSISIPGSAIPLFFRYLDELKQWNQAINLTAIDDDREVVVKHFVDSLAGLKVIEVTAGTTLLDVGAGAGFPALPLKIVRSDLLVEMLDPSEKKGAFLRYVVEALDLQQATVVTSKLEDYVKGRGSQRRYDYIVVRAFRVERFGFALGSLLKDTGKVVLYRSATVGSDFRLDGLALVREVEYELPSGYGHRVLSVFSKQ